MSAIEKFWRYFGESSHLLARDPDKEVMENLLSLLREIDQRLYFHLGEHDNGTDLILSAEGNPDLMDLLFELNRQRPQIQSWATVVSYSAELHFGDRDFAVFPDNSTGAALFRMASGGDRLWIERAIDFSVIFPTHAAAKAFCSNFESGDMKIDVSDYTEVDGFLVSINISKIMAPTAKNIGAFEDAIQLAADEHGGRNDGWGSFGAPDES